MTAINFNTPAAASVVSDGQPHRVYTRATWGDSWTEREDLISIQCIWNAAPNNSTAMLYRDYGRCFKAGSSTFVDRTPLSVDGSFVLIQWDNDESGINYWLGMVESVQDSPDGPTDGTIPASGSQTFACYGMERLLQIAPIVDTVWKSGTESTRSGGPTEFNKDGKPNRSASIITDETYVFDSDEDTAEFWSSRDIINHLLFYHLPTETGEEDSIPWSLANATLVPNWDNPRVNPEGMTVYGIINELLDSRLLLGWGVGFDNTTLTVSPFSISASAITLGAVTFPAALVQHSLTYSSDPLTTGEITIDRSDMVDQVIVRGARRQSVCTMKWASNEIVAGWTSTEETDYEAGASGDAGYSALDVLDQRQANERVRRSTYEKVYSHFKIASNWDYLVDGEVLEGSPVPERVFLPLDEEETDPYKPFRGAIRLEPYIPFVRGISYSGDLSLVPVSYATDFHNPLVTIDAPGAATGRVDITEIGERYKTIAGRSVDLTVSLDVISEELKLKLRVESAPQYAIAESTFSSLDEDELFFGQWDYTTMKATLCFTEDRYCEAFAPETEPTVEPVRRRVIYVGEEYRQIYLVPYTVVQLDSTGGESRSNGGYLRDDTEKLQHLADLFYAYHGSSRNSVSLTTSRRTGLCNVGDFITTANGTTINATITRMQIDAPLGAPNTAPRATQTIIASQSNINLLATLSKAGEAKRWMGRS